MCNHVKLAQASTTTATHTATTGTTARVTHPARQLKRDLENRQVTSVTAGKPNSMTGNST
ncbi:hypothetical protein GCM10017688_41210 [Streptomyces ramulosus]